jgi:hypothetical protein
MNDEQKQMTKQAPIDHVTLYYLHTPNVQPVPVFRTDAIAAFIAADPDAVVTLGPIMG